MSIDAYTCVSVNCIFSFPREEGNKSLEFFGHCVEGDNGDDGVFLSCSLVLLFRLFSSSCLGSSLTRADTNKVDMN